MCGDVGGGALPSPHRAFLGFGYGRWPSAAANLVVGTAMGEYQIYTHPDGAIR